MMFFFWIIALVIALSIHEYAHARAADELGDPTPRMAGRLTLNPLAHLDPIGTIALFLFHFGWGKPVPIDPYNLRNPRRDQAIIALSGPVSNFITAAVFAFVFRLSGSLASPYLSSLVVSIVIMNLGLGLFNLLPLGPLDGSKVLLGLLPQEKAAEWEEVFSRYGIIFLLIFFLPFPGGGSSLLNLTLIPLLNFFLRLLLPSASLV